MKTLLPIGIVIFLPIIVCAQGISGEITNKTGEAVPFTNVFVPELNKGATSNENGIYRLSLPEGVWEIEFRNIGFSSLEIQVKIDTHWVNLPIIINEQIRWGKDIKMPSSGEDHAWYIMRRAVAMAPYYKNQCSEYECSVYLKGTGRLGKIPKILKNNIEKQGIKVDYIFSTESFSKFSFQPPDKLKQTIIAQRSSGNDNGTSPMQMITNSLYNSYQYGVISPFDKQALQLYNFKLLGEFEDQGNTVNCIQITPKRKSKDLFEGILNITEGFWSIHSADLTINQGPIKSRMKQIYSMVDGIRLPVSHTFEITFNEIGFTFDYTYVSSISDYVITLNPGLDHSFFEKQQKLLADKTQLLEKFDTLQPMTVQNHIKKSDSRADIIAFLQNEHPTNSQARKINKLLQKEVSRSYPPSQLLLEEEVRISPDALVADSVIWKQIRPIPLTEKEVISFRRKDSLQLAHQQPAWVDSTEEMRSRFEPEHLLIGNTYNYKTLSSESRKTLITPGLMGMLWAAYNTVDGVKINFPFTWYSSDTLGHSITLKPEVGYAFARKKPDGQVHFNYLYNGRKLASVGVSAGSTTLDFNHATGMSTVTNDLMTLLFERNYKKFYLANFMVFSQQIEITNGLMFNANVGWASRIPLANNSNRRIIDWEERAFTPNIPENISLLDYQLEKSNSTELMLEIVWTHRQPYYLRNGFKIPSQSKYPTFTLNYRKGINDLLGSNTSFDLLQMEVSQKLTVGLKSKLEYQASLGGFLNNKNLHFADYRHFRTNYAEFSFGDVKNSFSLLPYYSSSTDQYFVEGHAMFESGRLFLKSLPLMTNTLMTEAFSMHFLHTDLYRYYTEFGYSLNNIFDVFNLAAVISFEKGIYKSTGFKLGIKVI